VQREASLERLQFRRLHLYNKRDGIKFLAKLTAVNDRLYFVAERVSFTMRGASARGLMSSCQPTLVPAVSSHCSMRTSHHPRPVHALLNLQPFLPALPLQPSTMMTLNYHRPLPSSGLQEPILANDMLKFAPSLTNLFRYNGP
jgi:hypothetical protein